MRNHRCAVCWHGQPTHDDWAKHVTAQHGAALTPFGYDACLGPQGALCPGVIHARKPPNHGEPRAVRVVDRGQPVRARDGTVYTPIPLPLENPE